MTVSSFKTHPDQPESVKISTFSPQNYWWKAETNQGIIKTFQSQKSETKHLTPTADNALLEYGQS